MEPHHPIDLSFCGHTKPRLYLLSSSFFLLLLLLFVLALISSSKQPSFPSFDYPHSSARLPAGCDISRGEWVPDPAAPYYTNLTCSLIQEHQNCMKYGRPDRDFLKWRWKPAACDLPAFDAARFLDLVRGKSMAFIGDSLARNHMQSLMCLLSKVEFPEDLNSTDNYFKRMFYANYNFTLSSFWSRFLVKAEEVDSDGPNHTGLWNLYLDEVDDSWASEIDQFDYVIVSDGIWFSHPTFFYEKRELVGCHFCLVDNVTDLPIWYSYRSALRTTLRSLIDMDGFKGKIFLRTISPSHFEKGEWNKGGDCVRRQPFKKNEARLEGRDLDFHQIQIEEFREAERVGREKGAKLKLLDATGAMLLRADGHPSRFGHWAHENVTLYNDCVHWCLPGPVDLWSNFLFAMMLDDRVD
ncbi:protein trichome birefringence-like 19 [Zingiber officinale]|uniref:protein trichome birefringence-like 19 n=1 Tax=Zingiber officinale TaxID=94328 RepID=UPI001C4D9F2A|nr:protein trichome birefringence-like 19 [Zingiber officinale]